MLPGNTKPTQLQTDQGRNERLHLEGEHQIGASTSFVTEEKPAWRQEQQRTFGKALGVAEQLATKKAKYITSEWYPFHQVHVHESRDDGSDSSSDDNIWSTGNCRGSRIVGDHSSMACRRGAL